jgi:hypothetical protein
MGAFQIGSDPAGMLFFAAFASASLEGYNKGNIMSQEMHEKLPGI